MRSLLFYLFGYSTRNFHFFFFFNDTATTEIYTLSLHDALPIWAMFRDGTSLERAKSTTPTYSMATKSRKPVSRMAWNTLRSEEHTSELQSQSNLVCRLLLEKKNKLTVELLNHIAFGFLYPHDWL